MAKTPTPFFFGVDVGGTNIKIGLVDHLGKTLAFESIGTDLSEAPQDAILRAAQTCRVLAARVNLKMDQISRAGLGTPGPLCLRRGMLLDPTNLPKWHGFHIRQALQDALGLEVSFINDANAAAYGEFWVGTGAEYGSLAMLTLGTGVGGGLITDGKLINGVNSFGSECGHMIVDSRPDARLCAWGGGKGHLEAYASASAVAGRANEDVRESAKSSLYQFVSEGRAITARDVHQAALGGDDYALGLIDDTAFYLGVGVSSVVHAIDPGLVVLGGAMNFGGEQCAVGRRFLKGVVDEFQRRTFSNVFEGTRIRFATLGGAAGYIGAAGIAHQDFQLQKQ